MIRQDHYYYEIMNRTVLCVDTQSAHLKRYSDINIKASTYNTITLNIYSQGIMDLLWNELARYFYN